ncbi:hypothetical protein, partial [Runella sp.]|uniref:hypothetical protein n=1 Tax=Runella sp. TaxID=1960881 RepID=UPI002603B43B
MVWPTRYPFFKDPLPLVSVFENPRRPLHALPSRSVKKPPAFPARPNAILVSFAVALLTLSGDINWKNYRHWIKKMRNFLSFPIEYVRHYQWVKTIKALLQSVNRLPSLTSRKSANNYRFSVCVTDTIQWDKFTTASAVRILSS